MAEAKADRHKDATRVHFSLTSMIILHDRTLTTTSPTRISSVYRMLSVILWLTVSTAPAAQLERKAAFLPDLLEYAMKGITNNGIVWSLEETGKLKYFFFLSAYSGQREAAGSPLLHMPWRLLERIDNNETYCLIGSGTYVEHLMSVTNANPSGKYGMPGSGFPRGSTNFMASLDVRLWANKVLGDCEDLYHLHTVGGKTNYVVLISKRIGKWIILELNRELEYAGYLDCGDGSYNFVRNIDANREAHSNDHKPMVYDESSKFEAFYGKTKVVETQFGKVRLWKHGDFIITHIDATPEKLIVSVTKSSEGDFNQREVFEIAERYSGEQEWSLEEKNERWSLYSSKDRRFKLTWAYKRFQDSKNDEKPKERVTVQFLLPNKELKKL